MNTLAASIEDLQEELDRERRIRHRAEADAERERRSARAFAELTAVVLGDHATLGLGQRLLEVFVAAAGADVGLLRLREGDRLHARAALGLPEEITLGRSLALAEHALPAPATLEASSAASGLVSDVSAETAPLREKGARTLYALPLIAAQQSNPLVGVLYLGRFADALWTEEEESLLSLLGKPAAAALARETELEDLKRAVVSRDDVLSVVAHDLQNPINVISIAANMLMQRSPDASARRSIERITRGAQRAARMIRDLLEVNAIESGRFTVQRRRMEPADLLLCALESQQSLAADASVIIASDLSPELPVIEADEERLLEVLENLIGNAIKFTSPGGSITVGAVQRGSEILMSVKDSGSGIGGEELPHIFDRFWQAKKALRRGTGLGLTICKAIVEAHGGEIWAESAVGVGTTLFFTVPTAVVVPSAASAQPAEVVNILLVDDRPENLFALQSILERPDYRLISATSGEEALRIALREHFVVALIDIAMPGMNGLEVAVHLKDLERSRDIPIIFITAFGDDPEEIHRAYSAGGADYLVKPLDIEIVRKKVAVFVDLSRKRNNVAQPH